MNKSKKIRLLCPIINDKNYGGGIKSTIALLNRLSLKKEFEIFVILNRNAIFKDKLYDNIVIHYFDYLDTISIYKPLRFYKILISVHGQLKNIGFIGKGVVLCSDRPSLMLMFGIHNKVNSIYVSRGGDYYNFSARLLKFFIFPSVKQFVAISNHQKNILVKHIKRKQCAVINNGFKISSGNFLMKNKRAYFEIGVIGVISDLKNQLQLLRIFKTLKKSNENLKLNIYGTCFRAKDHEYYKSLKSYILKNNIKDVDFHGYVKETNTIYNNLDLVVSTSKSEGFGRTIIEAMAYRTPVIANQNSGGPVDIINHKQTGLLYDGSDKDLIKNINHVINNPKKINSIIDNAYKSYLKNYTEEIMAEKYSELIKLANNLDSA